MNLNVIITGKDVLLILIAMLVLRLVVNVVRNVIGAGLDDSDRGGWDRSGLRVHTDAKTGVQYLSTKEGGITVRRNPDGTPVIEGGDK